MNMSIKIYHELKINQKIVLFDKQCVNTNQKSISMNLYCKDDIINF